MVKQLELAVRKAENLSDRDQQVIAAIIEAELADESLWQHQFETSPETLAKLALRAKRQYDEGSCGDL